MAVVVVMFTYGLDIELSVGLLPTLLFPHSAFYPLFRIHFHIFRFRILLSAFRIPQFRILPITSFDAPSPVNPREYLHKPYTARHYVPWATFLPCDAVCTVLVISARQHAERAICYRKSVCLSVRLSVRLSVCHTGGSVENGWTYHRNSFTIW